MFKQTSVPEQPNRFPDARPEASVPAALQACGGRISVTELPNEIGIALEHVESRVEANQCVEPCESGHVARSPS